MIINGSKYVISSFWEHYFIRTIFNWFKLKILKMFIKHKLFGLKNPILESGDHKTQKVDFSFHKINLLF